LRTSLTIPTKIYKASIKNPLAGISRPQLLRNVEEFAKEKDLIDILPILSKGAIRK
jgi:hypothetical protein